MDPFIGGGVGEGGRDCLSRLVYLGSSVVHFFRFPKPCRLSKSEYERGPSLKEKEKMINMYRKAK